MGKGFKFDGLEELQQGLLERAKMEDVKVIVKKSGADLQQTMQHEAKFRGHEEWKAGQGMVHVDPSGQTQRSIDLEITDNGMTASSGPTTEYSPYLEYGTRHMEAQPFVGPAFNKTKVKFKQRLDKLFK